MAWNLTGNIKGPAGSADSTIPINVQTGTAYTLVAGDAGKEVRMQNTAANTMTIDASVLPTNGAGLIRQVGTGQTSITAASGTTIVASGDALAFIGAACTWHNDGNGTVYLNGEFE